MSNPALEAMNSIRDMVFVFAAIAVIFSFTGVVVARSFAGTKSSRTLIWQIFTATGVFVGMYVSRRFTGE